MEDALKYTGGAQQRVDEFKQLMIYYGKATYISVVKRNVTVYEGTPGTFQYM